MIEIAIEYKDLGLDIGRYRAWLERVAIAHKYSISDITYILTTDPQLLELNRDYLQHDYYTDILTFDRSEGGVLSGDVYISIDRVKENAKVYDVEFEEELKRVMVHGVLHMMGYRDNEEKETKRMRQAENKAIELFHVKQ